MQRPAPFPREISLSAARASASADSAVTVIKAFSVGVEFLDAIQASASELDGRNFLSAGDAERVRQSFRRMGMPAAFIVVDGLYGSTSKPSARPERPVREPASHSTSGYSFFSVIRKKQPPAWAYNQKRCPHALEPGGTKMAEMTIRPSRNPRFLRRRPVDGRR